MMISSILFSFFLTFTPCCPITDVAADDCRHTASFTGISGDDTRDNDPGSAIPLAIADPYVIYDGETGVYYAYGTSAPDGFKAYVSEDLVHWRQADTQLGGGYVLRKGHSVFGDANFWAPEVWKIGDTYYMLYTADFSLCVARSSSPLGPFVQPEEPYCLVQGAIDHTLCIDDATGEYYLCFNATRNGRNSIYMARVEKDFSSMAPESEWRLCLTTDPGTWEEIQNQIIEGPFIIRHGGRYYLTYSANDYRSQDYAVGYAVSDTLFPGRWEKAADNPILRRPAGLVGTGHSSFFTGADGQLYIVFHAHPDRESYDPRHMYVSRAWIGEDGTLKVAEDCTPAFLIVE